MKGKIIAIVLLTGLMGCSFEKEKLTPKDTDGFTQQDMDKGANEFDFYYPHVQGIVIQAEGLKFESPWDFYVAFDKVMDTSLIPDVSLQELTYHNQVTSTNYVDKNSIKWLSDNILTFRTSSTFKPYSIIDYPFDPNADGAVYSIALQSDGKILIGGDFTSVGGTPRNHIARLNPDGSVDTFDPNANNTVRSIAIQSDGKILIGGDFTNVGGTARNHIARLNPDGSVDTTFDPDANGTVFSIAVQSDGKILIGGAFTTLNGGTITRRRIARLNPDGSVDTFDPNADNTVRSIAVQLDGKILIGGDFTTLNGGTITRRRIARLNPDGSVDTFDPNANNTVRSIAIQSDGKILIGGDFITVGGTARKYIARLNSDGSVDTTFDPNANGPVHSIAVQSDGKILIGGDFTTLNGGTITRRRIARLNPDGSVDTFDSNANNTVRSIAIQSDGKILIGGDFTTLNNGTIPPTPRNHIARLKRICVPEEGRECDNYLLTIGSKNTRSILGVELDGNYRMTNDDYIASPSDFIELLSNLTPPPSPFPGTFHYDITPASVDSADADDYLKPELSDARVNERINIHFDSYMRKSDINNTNIEIIGPDGKKLDGSWWVEDLNNPGNYTSLESAPETTTGRIETYYSDFYFRPKDIPLPLGRYVIIVHCNSIHKFPITDPVNGVFQREITCNDFEYDGVDNDVIMEFYVTPDGEKPPVTNVVWAVYTWSSAPIAIQKNQAVVFFQTPDPMDNIMDASTLIPKNISLIQNGTPLSITTSVQTIIYQCAPSTALIITAGKDITLPTTPSPLTSLTISYSVKDEEGNTLDGNYNGIYELSINDNFDPNNFNPPTGIPFFSPYYDPLLAPLPPNYVQVQGVWTANSQLTGYTLGSDEILIAFKTPAMNDDRMNTSSLTADDIILEGAGDPDRPNCTCRCPGPDCGGDLIYSTLEDSSHFNNVPTTLWRIKFTNPSGCVVKDCKLTVRGGTINNPANRPKDVCGNWLYPDYVVERLP
jgi:uncharacterized delta-60 repeat protein